MPKPEALAVFLTWRTYGTWLPGDERGWVDERRHGFGENMHRADYRLAQAAQGLMRAAPMELSSGQRELIDQVIREACAFRDWPVIALNVRTNHVHLVVASTTEPRKMLNLLKTRVSTLVRHAGIIPADRPLWSRGGSTRMLFSEESLAQAVDYVLNRQ